jgi:hypothetical protein
MSDEAPAQNGPRDARGRFGPGNPGGGSRVTGSRSKALLELDEIGQEGVEDIIHDLKKRALNGDVRAAEIVLKRVWIPRRSRPIKLDLPKIETAADAVGALGLLVEAAAAGGIDLDSAKTLSEIIGQQQRSLELQELAERIEALEARAQGGT